MALLCVLWSDNRRITVSGPNSLAASKLGVSKRLKNWLEEILVWLFASSICFEINFKKYFKSTSRPLSLADWLEVTKKNQGEMLILLLPDRHFLFHTRRNSLLFQLLSFVPWALDGENLRSWWFRVHFEALNRTAKLSYEAARGLEPNKIGRKTTSRCSAA